MFRRIGVVLAVTVFAVAAAVGTARASGVPTTITIVCADGTTWVLDPEWADAAAYGDAFCDGDYTVVDPSASSDSSGADSTSWDGGGTAIGLGADAAMAPDPSQYVTEVQCPDGQIWAVASGDDFVCPAA